MNNLHRELAPLSAAAWAEIEQEARRTFKRHLAGRRVVDVAGPGGTELAAVGTGHLLDVEPPAAGVISRLREVVSLVELRVPFFVSREAIDDVDRGSKDSDWQPVKDAAKQMAFAEDRAIFEGYAAAAGIDGLRRSSSNPALATAGRSARLPEHRQPGAVGAAAGRRQRALLGAAVGRCLHRRERDVRPRLPDPRASRAGGRRRDHLGAGDRRRIRGQHPRRRLRTAYRTGPFDRLPDP